MSQILYRVAKRWIAGQSSAEALEVTRVLNLKGQGVMLNYLGEDILDPKLVSAHLQEYLQLQRAINEKKLDACVSVKLTQLGLGIDDGTVRQNLILLSEEASRLRQFLWIDMESSKYTQATLSIYMELIGSFPAIGVALQAYLKRTEADAMSILEKGGKIRLVKGAYRESSEIAFTKRYQISQNYVKILEEIFRAGGRVAVATHDSRLIAKAKELARDSKSEFEFQMLKGIRDEMKERLVSDGYRVVTYLPYGTNWYSYSKRRITEHPSNIWLILRSLF
jgi:proline dehydrogenase